MISVVPLDGRLARAAEIVIVDWVGARSCALVAARDQQQSRAAARSEANRRNAGVVDHSRYQSAYIVPSSARPSDPLFTSNTPGCADGFAGSISDIVDLPRRLASS